MESDIDRPDSLGRSDRPYRTACGTPPDPGPSRRVEAVPDGSPAVHGGPPSDEPARGRREQVGAIRGTPEEQDVFGRVSCRASALAGRRRGALSAGDVLAAKVCRRATGSADRSRPCRPGVDLIAYLPPQAMRLGHRLPGLLGVQP